MKEFNTTGLCVPTKHYMVDISKRLELMKTMVEEGKYFTVNRGRQYGKTTTLKMLARYLKDDYVVLSLDFKGISSEGFKSESTFVQELSKMFVEAAELRGMPIPQEYLDMFSQFAYNKNGDMRLSDIFTTFLKWCNRSDKPIVLIIDEVDEYAYLKQEDAAGLPRLVQRYQLSYPVSMLLVQLRKALGEQDTASGDTRLVISFADIMRRMDPFLPVPGNEMKFRQSLEHTIGQVMQLGFLQKLKGSEDEYEVRPVLRSFVDAQWLSDFNEKLAEYEAHGQMLHQGAAEDKSDENEGEEGLLGEFVRNE
jgi:hypothetical protein